MVRHPTRKARSSPLRQACRHAALFYVAGAVITLVSLAVPHPDVVDDELLATTAVLLLLGAAIMGFGGDRLPRWSLDAVSAFGVLLVSLELLSNGERNGGGADGTDMYYLWPVLFAAYHLSRRTMLAMVVLVALAHALALHIIDPGAVAPSRWVTTVGLVAATGVMVRALIERNAQLIADLERLARHDDLTGLANRRAMDELSSAEVERATRTGRPFGLVALDLDGFKQLNDRDGHAAGDAALVAVATALTGALREIDTVARLGGDEFVLLLPDTEAAGALDAAQRAADAALGLSGLRLSYGVAVFGEDGLEVDALLRAADTRLYEAKRRRSDGPRPPQPLAA